MVDLITPEGHVATPTEVVEGRGAPDTIAGWKALAEGLLTDQSCVFHRNLEISSRYAWIYRQMPAYLKWTGMAAFASHHVRLALYPLRMDTDRTGYADLERSVGRRRALLLGDIHTLRTINNAIFDDIFWVHLAYASSLDGIARLRDLLGAERSYAPVLAGFEAIDRGRRIVEDPTVSPEDRRAGEEIVWDGNIALLEHEQRALVQPHFDQLSCTFARLFSLGSTLSFEVRGVRHEAAYFSSFYLYSFGRGLPLVLRAHAWPRVTRFEDRWRWIVTRIVPRFRRLDADERVLDASLRRIFTEARHHSSTTCVVPPAVGP